MSVTSIVRSSSLCLWSAVTRVRDAMNETSHSPAVDFHGACRLQGGAALTEVSVCANL